MGGGYVSLTYQNFKDAIYLRRWGLHNSERGGSDKIDRKGDKILGASEEGEGAGRRDGGYQYPQEISVVSEQKGVIHQ